MMGSSLGRTGRSWMAFSLLCSSLALVMPACGDNGLAPPPDAGPIDAKPADAMFVEAVHPPVPQVISGGGPVLTAPKIVPIFFTGDDTVQGEIEGCLAALSGSDYWTTATSEYGVGMVTIEPTVVSTDVAPTTDSALRTWLKSNTDGTHDGWPVPDDNTIYAVFLPPGDLLTTNFGSSCKDFGAYHDEGSDTQGGRLVYALMPRCPSNSSVIDQLTSAASHEFIEAATDPFPFSNTAFDQLDSDHQVWGNIPGGEIGDMCEYVEAAYQYDVGTYLVQRVWSNASAMAGHDPCVPALDAPYTAAAPVFTMEVGIGGAGPDGQAQTQGIEVALASTVTIPVKFYSDAPNGYWSVAAYDATAFISGTTTGAELSLGWDEPLGTNGETHHLNITRLADGQSGGSEFVIASRDANGKIVSLWWGYVEN